MSDKNEKNTISTIAWFAIVAVLIMGGVGGFVVGFQTGKSSLSSGTPTIGANGPGSPGGMMGMGAFGTVTAISDNSITINDQRTSKEQTFKIGSSTMVTDNGETAALSDIKVDDRAMVQTDSDSDDSTSSTATAILLNPSMGGAPGVGPTSSN